MSPHENHALEGIARLLKDREMARLAKLQAEQRALQAQRAALQVQAQEARMAGQKSLELFAAAARFDGWVSRRDAEFLTRMQELQGRIDGQQPVTARAVGREENIRKLFEQMRQREKLAQQRRNGV